MGRKVQVSFTDEQIKLLKRAKGSLGNTDAEVVRNIVLAWMAEKSILSSNIKEKEGR